MKDLLGINPDFKKKKKGSSTIECVCTQIFSLRKYICEYKIIFNLQDEPMKRHKLHFTGKQIK